MKREVHLLAFTPDGRWLISGSYDGTIRLWDLTTPTARPIVLREQEGPVYTLAISEDGAWLASGGADGIVRLWQLANPATQLYMLAGHSGVVNSVAFSPNGCWLATGSGDSTARLWDLTEITDGVIDPANCTSEPHVLSSIDTTNVEAVGTLLEAAGPIICFKGT